MKIKVNNIELYYEVKGSGKEIILLHGNRENHHIFNELINKLSKEYKVYAIDSRNHGQSEKSNEISYELMRDDIIDFIYKLKIKKPILYGFSDGGIVGLLISIKEPNILSKLIVSGANLYPKGFKKYMLVYAKLGFIFTKNKLFRLMYEEPNINIYDLQKITIPTYLTAGKYDIVKTSHTKLINENIKNSKLEIINHKNHSNYVLNNNSLYNIIIKYIKEGSSNEKNNINS